MLAFFIYFFIIFYLGSFSYTSHAGFLIYLKKKYISREFLLHIPCWVYLYLGCFSYTSRAGFTFLWGVSLRHPMLASFLSFIFHQGSFSYTSRAGFIFIWGVSITQSVLALILSGEFLLHIPCWLYYSVWSFSYTSHTGFKKIIWRVSPHTSCAGSFFFFVFVFCLFVCLSREFLLDILCWLYFSLWNFSYTSLAGLIFTWGVSIPHPVVASFLSGEFLLHILCWLIFFFIWGVSLTHPELALLFFGEFLLDIPC